MKNYNLTGYLSRYMYTMSPVLDQVPEDLMGKICRSVQNPITPFVRVRLFVEPLRRLINNDAIQTPL